MIANSTIAAPAKIGISIPRRLFGTGDPMDLSTFTAEGIWNFGDAVAGSSKGEACGPELTFSDLESRLPHCRQKVKSRE
jgi:hypothetical protein